MGTIIVQETDSDILEMLCIALELEGFNIYAVLGYDTDFLELIAKLRPHVVMLDYLLKGSECIRICRLIKAVYPHLPVIALSCNNNINGLYHQHGFDGYISKPFDLDVLYKLLRKFIPKPDNDALNYVKLK